MSILKQNIIWLGHASFRINAEKTIYFDPYKIPENQPKADAVLVSHSHHDHLSPEDLKKICTDKTVIYMPKNCQITGIPGKIIHVLPLNEYSGDGFSLKTVPAYNINKQFHSKKNNWVGFILSINGTTIYHAGDSDNIPEMKNLNVDFALLPVSGTYTMDAKEAASAYKEMSAKVGIPMHYGSGIGASENAELFLSLISEK